MVSFIIGSKAQWPQENKKNTCQSLIIEGFLTKEALKTWQLFFSMSVLGMANSLKKGA